jgi:chromate transporter
MSDESNAGRDVRLSKLFGVFLYIGATSFGGGVVAYFREHLVDRQKWLSEDEFLATLEIGQIVPGLMATNVSVLVGNHLRGLRGSIAAVIGMAVPGASVVFVLGLLYARFKNNPEVGAVLNGVAAAAVGLILEVALRLGQRELTKWQDFAILIPAFLLVGVFHISLVPVLVVLVPIAIQINRPNRQELAAYHARQAEYHSKLADHHEETAAIHRAAESGGSGS